MISQDDPLFNVAKYMIACANGFFRLCRGSGTFLSGRTLEKVVLYGMDMNEPCPRYVVKFWG